MGKEGGMRCPERDACQCEGIGWLLSRQRAGGGIMSLSRIECLWKWK